LLVGNLSPLRDPANTSRSQKCHESDSTSGLATNMFEDEIISWSFTSICSDRSSTGDFANPLHRGCSCIALLLCTRSTCVVSERACLFILLSRSSSWSLLLSGGVKSISGCVIFSHFSPCPKSLHYTAAERPHLTKPPTGCGRLSKPH
jgi:hypothetical protein